MNRFVVIALLCILLLSCAARADGITTEAPDVTATDVSTDTTEPLTSSAAPQETTLTPTDTSNALDTSSSPASATSTSSSPTATAATAATASLGPTPAISLSPTAATAQAPPTTTTNGITASPPTAATTTTATSTQAPTAPSTIPPPPATTSTMAPPPPTANVVTTPAPSAGRVLLLIATAVNGSLISTPPLFAVAIAQCTETDVTLIGTFSYTDLDPDQSRNFTFFVRSSDDSQQPSRTATEELLRKATSSHRRTCANRGIVNVRADGIDEAEAMEDEGSIVGWVIAVVVVVISIVVFLVFSVRRERAIEASRRQLKALVEMELAPAPPIGDLSRLGLGNDTITNNNDDDDDDDVGPRLGVDETPLLVPLIAASMPGDPATALPAAAAPHDEALFLPPATATAEDASAPPSHYEPVSLPDAPPAVSAPPPPSEDVAQVSASEAEAAEPTDDLRDETIDANCAATPATAGDLDGPNGGNTGNDDATGVLSALPDPTTDPNL